MIRIWFDSSKMIRMMIRFGNDSTSTKWFDYDSIRNVQHDSSWFGQKRTLWVPKFFHWRSEDLFPRPHTNQNERTLLWSVYHTCKQPQGFWTHIMFASHNNCKSTQCVHLKNNVLSKWTQQPWKTSIHRVSNCLILRAPEQPHLTYQNTSIVMQWSSSPK